MFLNLFHKTNERRCIFTRTIINFAFSGQNDILILNKGAGMNEDLW